MIQAAWNFFKLRRQAAKRRIWEMIMRADGLVAESRTGLAGAKREADRRAGPGRGRQARLWRSAADEISRRIRATSNTIRL
ncbi:MAG: hypothetical protein JWM33_2230 [Caulobacteraceae bacterium]|nr:hypothetical protein [Caulobacteraceae bacterium]